MYRWTDDQAVAQVIAVLVAGTLFVTLVGAVILAANQMGTDDTAATGASQDLDASRILGLLVDSPGVGWEGGPDHIVRLGLANATGPGFDLDKLHALRGASFEADPINGLIDYEEALVSLGLDPALPGGFHLRVSPVDLGRLLQEGHKGHLRAGYIGDWNGLSSVTVDALASEEAARLEAQAKVDLQMAVGTREERDAIAAMGMQFLDAVYMDGSHSIAYVEALFLGLIPLQDFLGLPFIDGDVYPDHKAYLEQVLPGRLQNYDLLIVGSGVAHNALNEDTIKFAIRDWVLDGGSLMVFGSQAQNFQWLQPIFSVGTKTVNGGPYAPDLSHPLLHVPNSLDWTNYQHFGLGWEIKDVDDFQHVVVSGDGKTILAVSVDGAFGDGRVFLTTYRVKDIVANMGAAEGGGFLENMVVYGDRSSLFLDYGPPVPRDVQVSAAVGHTTIPDPDLGPVPVRVEVLAWAT